MAEGQYIFLSYARAESEFAHKLAADLKNAGWSLWVDTWEIKTGQDWRRKLELGVNNCVALISVLSPKYLTRPYCMNELRRADELPRPIIPILLSHIPSSDWPIAIQEKQYSDFRDWRNDASYQKQLKELIEALPIATSLEVVSRPPAEIQYINTLIAELGKYEGVEEYIELASQTTSRPEPQKIKAAGLELLTHDRKETFHFKDIHDVITRHPRFVLIGEPGAGKTTTLRRLAIEAAQTYLENPRTAPTPLYLRLPEWASIRQQENISFSEFISRYWKKKGLPTESNPIVLINQGNVNLYFDGLNEMGSQGGTLAKELSKWIADNSPNQMVVTCRLLDYANNLELDTLPTVLLEEMDKQQVEQFAKNYLQDKADSFLQKIFQNSEDERSFFRLARNPYLLSALITVFLAGGDLPRNNGLLFQGLTKALWEREWRIENAISPTERLTSEDEARFEESFEEMTNAFAKLAFAMIDEYKPIDVSVDYALKHLESDLLLERGKWANFIDVNGNEVRFYHQLMQEYFAAVNLDQIGSQRFTQFLAIFKEFIIYFLLLSWRSAAYYLLAFFYRAFHKVTLLESLIYSSLREDSKWREVIISLAGITKNPDSLITELATKNPILAADCAITGIQISSSATNEILSGLEERLQSISVPREHVKALGRLNHPKSVTILGDFIKDGSKDAGSRELAVQTLGKMRNPTAIPILLRLLDDNDDEISWFASLALGKMGKEAVEPLLKLLLNPHSDRWNNARVALTGIGNNAGIGNDATPEIVEALFKFSDRVQLERLAHVLVRLPELDERAIPGLMFILRHCNQYREDCRIAIDRLGEIKATSELVELLSILNDTSLSWVVAGNLYDIGTPEALSAVEEWKQHQD